MVNWLILEHSKHTQLSVVLHLYMFHFNQRRKNRNSALWHVFKGELVLEWHISELFSSLQQIQDHILIFACQEIPNNLVAIENEISAGT